MRGDSTAGGSLVRKHPQFANSWGYAVQLMEIDHLAIEINRPVPRGPVGQQTTIALGVELDSFNSPVAYHIYPNHPGDIRGQLSGFKAIRIPASEMLHICRVGRVSESIGVPSMSSSLMDLKMLRAYHEAELIAAREAACKGYGIKQATPEGYAGPQDDQGRIVEPVEPGMGLLLNPGEDYFPIDPNHPVEAFDAFNKAILRSIASGLGVSYNSLANDLEGVNYSSIRAGLLEEREEWKTKQEWLIEELCDPIFEDWLIWALTNGKLGNLGMKDFERVNQAKWTPRRWPWVDPLKDVQATIQAIAARLESRQQALAEQGKDIEDIDADFESDEVTNEIDPVLAYTPTAQQEPLAPEEDTPPTNGKERFVMS